MLGGLFCLQLYAAYDMLICLFKVVCTDYVVCCGGIWCLVLRNRLGLMLYCWYVVAVLFC